jgi:hypothetical protein
MDDITRIQRNASGVFILLAYGITWLIARPIVLSHIGRLQGVPLTIHYLLPYGTPLSALIVTSIMSGREGLRDILGRMTKARIKPVWLGVRILSVS